MSTENISGFKRWGCCILAAILAPTLLTTCYLSAIILASPWGQMSIVPFIAFMAFLVSTAHMLFLALPGVLALVLWRRFNIKASMLLGVVTGGLPMAVWTWPYQYATRNATSSHWDGEKMVNTMTNGEPTLSFWLSYAGGVGSMALLGMVAGLAFCLVWKKMHTRSI